MVQVVLFLYSRFEFADRCLARFRNCQPLCQIRTLKFDDHKNSEAIVWLLRLGKGIYKTDFVVLNLDYSLFLHLIYHLINID